MTEPIVSSFWLYNNLEDPDLIVLDVSPKTDKADLKTSVSKGPENLICKMSLVIPPVNFPTHSQVLSSLKTVVESWGLTIPVKLWYMTILGFT